MDHVSWIKFQTVDRLKSRAKAESEWWDAVADLKLGRDFEGPGECSATLGCKRPECAGGKLRLHIHSTAFVLVSEEKGRLHRSITGTKQKRKFKDIPAGLPGNRSKLVYGLLHTVGVRSPWLVVPLGL
jgi:hypothetical protein